LGQGDYGPPLQGNATIADTSSLEELLRQGKGNMPAVGATWDDQTMDSAVGYLQERFGGG
jgi:mono/diheme cytochrome c family protein